MMNLPHEDKDRSGLMAAIFGCSLAALVAVGTAVAMVRSADIPMARIGDIVAFNQPMPANSGAEVVVVRVADDQPTRCVLDPAVLAGAGGSLVVEEQDWRDGRTYRVHWAGDRTASGAGNCGASADLAINESDLNTLAIAAGGYGVTNKTIALSYPVGSAAMALN